MALVNALQAQTVGHIFIYGFWKRIGFLEHHTYAATQGRYVHIGRVDVIVIQHNLALDTATVYQVIHAIETT